MSDCQLVSGQYYFAALVSMVGPEERDLVLFNLQMIFDNEIAKKEFDERVALKEARKKRTTSSQV